MSNFKDQKLVEQIEILAGTRNAGDRSKAAIRVEDLTGVMNFAVKLQSETVTAAPTAAQHNALVKDVRRIHNLLIELSRAVAVRANRA